MLTSFKDKIKTAQEIRAIIGDRPRRQKVIMCHGTFDVIHPGHLRHLMYAKEKADILVTSLTCDHFITKGPHRPYVPEELRATNLAALEMVDYVLVDQNPTPIDLISILQPDYFAKGFEYIGDGLHPKTQEEVDALELYGGEVVFTPGDIVYSSSTLLNLQQPNLALDKLLVLMESEGVTFDDLRHSLRAVAGLKVHVLGDTIVDKYTYCTLLGAAPKTPTFSVKQDRSELFIGGAAIVAKHARSFGAEVHLSTVLGDDAMKDLVLDEMHAANVGVSALVDGSRPTTVKERFIAEGNRLLQVDTVDNRIISDRMVGQFRDSIEATKSDAYVFSDFRHGIFHHNTISLLAQAIPKGAFRSADSQVSSRWGNILEFQGFDLVTPNEREARFSLGDQDSVIRPLATKLYSGVQCRWLILKLGERGVLCHRGSGAHPREFFNIDSFVDTLVDPIGAGDSLLALATLVLAQSGNFVHAAILGIISAALACERDGNIPVTIDEVTTKLDRIERATHL